MGRIVISEPMHGAAVATLRARHDVLYEPTLADDGSRLYRLASDCEALVVGGRTQVRAPLLEAMARCKALACLTSAEDNVDLDACARRRIEVVSESGALAASTAEYVIGAALLLLHGAFLAVPARGEGGAAPDRTRRREAAGKTIGIVGMGAVGRTVASLAQRVRMKVLAFDPAMDPSFPEFPVSGVDFAPLADVLGAADVVTLHLPARQRAQYRFDAARIGRIRPGAILIDTSCNRTIDTAAVAAALRRGALGGAALDNVGGVLESVPELAGCPNLIVSPCLAEDTLEASERIAQQVAVRLQQILR